MLTEDQKMLGKMIQRMEPPQVRKVLDFVQNIGANHSANQEFQVDADELTDEDLRAVSKASLLRFAERHPDDDWGFDEETTTKSKLNGGIDTH